MTDFLTILKHDTIPLTKLWIVDSKGKPKEVEPDLRPKFFSTCKAEADTLEELYEALVHFSAENAQVIRGALVPGRGVQVDEEWIEGVARTKIARNGEPACFREVPHQWVMFDIDWPKEKLEVDLSTPESCLASVNKVIGVLPFELRTAGCVWQWSAGAGFKPGARVHLWFWLDRPMGSKELKRWVDMENELHGWKLIDPATCDEVQQHYIAEPVLEGVADRVAKRLGIITGKPVSLPRLTEKKTAYKKHLIELKSGKDTEIHKHLRTACASYFCGHGPDADGRGLALELREAVDVAERVLNRVGDYSDAKLEAEIASGREFARNKAVEAENLLLDKSGEIKPVDSNARALLLGSPEWHDVLVLNKRSAKAEFRLPPPWHEGDEFEPREVTEEDAGRLGDWLHKRFNVGFRNLMCWDALHSVASRVEYDPVRDYLNSLPGTNDTALLDTWLKDWCHAGNAEIREDHGPADEAEYVRRVGRMTLISAVARAMTEEEVKVDTILVLEGAQGALKSTLIQTLAGRENYRAHNDASSNERDALAKFYGRAWLLEFKEMVSLGKGAAKVKALLDASSDEFRRAYRRDEANYIRRCIGIATTNENTYLEDATGNRRFWPVQVNTIDIEKVEALRDRLWAEAVSAYRRGERWWAEPGDILFVKAQEGAARADSWEEVIKAALEKGVSNWFAGEQRSILPGAEFITSADVMICILRDDRQDRRNQMRVADILKKLGWVQVKRNGIRGWFKNNGKGNKEINLEIN